MSKPRRGTTVGQRRQSGQPRVCSTTRLRLNKESSRPVMKRILRLILILCVTYTLIISLAILIGHLKPLTASLTMLHLTKCDLPCWIGIVPGKTTQNEAVELLKRDYSDNANYELLNTIGS